MESLSKNQIEECENYIEATKVVKHTSKLMLLKYAEDILMPKAKRQANLPMYQGGKTAQGIVCEWLGISDSIFFRWKQVVASGDNETIDLWNEGKIETQTALSIIKSKGLETSLRKASGEYYLPGIKSEFRELWNKSVDTKLLVGMTVYEKFDMRTDMTLVKIPAEYDGTVWIAKRVGGVKRLVPIDSLCYDPNKKFASKHNGKFIIKDNYKGGCDGKCD